jgi:hypothetical protein
VRFAKSSLPRLQRQVSKGPPIQPLINLNITTTTKPNSCVLRVRLPPYTQRKYGSIQRRRRASKHPHSLHPRPIPTRPLRLLRLVLLRKQSSPHPNPPIPRANSSRSSIQSPLQHILLRCLAQSRPSSRTDIRPLHEQT